MSCRSCSKDIEKKFKEKLNLPEESSLESIVNAWALLYSKLFDELVAWKKIVIPDEFIQEAQLLLVSLDLIDYLKKTGNNNKSAINTICAMAYCGLIEATEDDDIWKLKQAHGSVVAHWAARGGRLTVPYNSSLWRIKNKNGDTPAHYAAENGHLKDTYDSDLWRIGNKWGDTPAHWAAEKGHLNAPYESDLWRMKNERGDTPAHWAAEKGHLNAPYESDLWRIKNNWGCTPAHQASFRGYLKVPYESDLWRIKDDNGNTPAHQVATRGLLNAPHESDLWRIEDKWRNTPAHNAALNGHLNTAYDSDLWRIQDVYGETPAHRASSQGKLNAPYRLNLWLIPNNRQQTPADLSSVVLTVLLHHSNNIVKQYFYSKNIDANSIRNVWDVLGYVRTLALMEQFPDDFHGINFQNVINETHPFNPELCDFNLIFKNITQKWLLEKVSKSKQMRDLYCYALAGALSYLFNEYTQNIRNILLNKHYAYIEDTTYSLLVEYELWTVIEKIACKKYGISLENLVI